MAGISSLFEISSACVPLPAPGAPIIIKFITFLRMPVRLSAKDSSRLRTAVVAKRNLSLEVVYRLNSNAYNDKQ